MSSDEPRWVSRAVLDAIHADQIRQHGGAVGMRDEMALLSALDRAPNRRHFAPRSDLTELAAAYAVGIARNHPFVDGNKRTAFQTMFVFLGLNGLRIVAHQPEVVTLFRDVAAGSVDEAALSEWLRSHTEPRD
jgi:death on curing protein